MRFRYRSQHTRSQVVRRVARRRCRTDLSPIHDSGAIRMCHRSMSSLVITRDEDARYHIEPRTRSPKPRKSTREALNTFTTLLLAKERARSPLASRASLRTTHKSRQSANYVFGPSLPRQTSNRKSMRRQKKPRKREVASGAERSVIDRSTWRTLKVGIRTESVITDGLWISILNAIIAYQIET